MLKFYIYIVILFSITACTYSTEKTLYLMGRALNQSEASKK